MGFPPACRFGLVHRQLESSKGWCARREPRGLVLRSEPQASEALAEV